MADHYGQPVYSSVPLPPAEAAHLSGLPLNQPEAVPGCTPTYDPWEDLVDTLTSCEVPAPSMDVWLSLDGLVHAPMDGHGPPSLAPPLNEPSVFETDGAGQGAGTAYRPMPGHGPPLLPCVSTYGLPSLQTLDAEKEVGSTTADVGLGAVRQPEVPYPLTLGETQPVQPALPRQEDTESTDGSILDMMHGLQLPVTPQSPTWELWMTEAGPQMADEAAHVHVPGRGKCAFSKKRHVEDQLEKTRCELAAAEAQIVKLKESNKELLQDYEAATARAEHFKGRHTRLSGHINKGFLQEVVELAEAQVEKEKALKACAEAQGKLAETQKKFTASRKGRRTAEAEWTRLTEDLKKCGEGADRTKTELQQARWRVQELESATARLDSQLVMSTNYTKNLERELQTAQEKATVANTALTALQVSSQQLEADLVTSQAHVEELERELQLSREEVTAGNTIIATLRTSSASITGELDQAVATLSASQCQVADLQSQLAAAQQMIQTRTAELEHARSSSSVPTLRAQLLQGCATVLNKRYDELKRSCEEQLKGAAEQAEMYRLEAERAAAQLNVVLTTSQTRMASLAADLRHAQERASAADAEIQKLCTDRVSVVVAQEEALSALTRQREKEMKALQSQLAAVQSDAEFTILAAQNKATELLQCCDGLRDANARATQRITELDGHVQVSAERVLSLEQELELARRDSAEAQSQVRALHAKVEEVSGARAAAETSVKQAEQANAQSQMELTALRVQMGVLQVLVSDLDGRCAAMLTADAALRSEVEQATRSREEAERTVAEYQAETSVSQARVASLSNELALAHGKSTAMQTELTHLRDEWHSAVTARKEVQGALMTAQQQLGLVRVQLSEAKTETEQANTRITTLEEEAGAFKADAEAKLQAAASQTAALQKTCNDLQTANGENMLALALAQEGSTAMQAVLNNLRDELQSAVTAREEVQAALTTTQQQLGEVRVQLSEAEGERRQRGEELQTANTRIGALEKEANGFKADAEGKLQAAETQTAELKKTCDELRVSNEKHNMALKDVTGQLGASNGRVASLETALVCARQEKGQAGAELRVGNQTPVRVQGGPIDMSQQATGPRDVEGVQTSVDERADAMEAIFVGERDQQTSTEPTRTNVMDAPGAPETIPPHEEEAGDGVPTPPPTPPSPTASWAGRLRRRVIGSTAGPVPKPEPDPVAMRTRARIAYASSTAEMGTANKRKLNAGKGNAAPVTARNSKRRKHR